MDLLSLVQDHLKAAERAISPDMPDTESLIAIGRLTPAKRRIDDLIAELTTI